jgi:DNA-binding CsgD family transcriptional regulator
MRSGRALAASRRIAKDKNSCYCLQYYGARSRLPPSNRGVCKMRTRSISSDKGANGGDGGTSDEVGRIVLGERVFVVVLAAKSPLSSAPDPKRRFKIDGVEFAAIESPDQPDQRLEANEIASRLTGRELEIAVLVAQGCATKNIAFRRRISEWTVATYLRRIFAKLDVSSRAAMVYRCAPLIDRVAEAAKETDLLEGASAGLDRASLCAAPRRAQMS